MVVVHCWADWCWLRYGPFFTISQTEERSFAPITNADVTTTATTNSSSSSTSHFSLVLHITPRSHHGTRLLTLRERKITAKNFIVASSSLLLLLLLLLLFRPPRCMWQQQAAAAASWNGKLDDNFLLRLLYYLSSLGFICRETDWATGGSISTHTHKKREKCSCGNSE